MSVFFFRTFPTLTDNRNAGNTENKVPKGCIIVISLYLAGYLQTSKSETILLMMFQMAPHKRVASLLNISSALLSHQLLFFLVGKEKTEEEKVEVEEEDAEETTNLVDVGHESGKTQRGCEEISNRGLEEYSVRGKHNALGNNDLRNRDLGNDDLVEILASLGLLAGMMDTILEDLNTRVGDDKM